MAVLTPDEAAAWTSGSWDRPFTESLRSVGHDTRTMKPGSLYVALKGARVDGHTLLPRAKAAGAVAALVERGRAQPCLPCLEVGSPEAALGLLAKGARSKINVPVVGITGSAGKTTVKNFLAAMLRQRGPTCGTPGNWNNFIGLPLSLLAMELSDEFGVFELGMNSPGEISRLAEICRPDIGIITSIGAAHLERLESVEAIAREKTDLFTALPESGIAVVDVDSSWLDLMRKKINCGQVSVSLEGEADLQGSPVEGGLEIHDRIRDERWLQPLPYPGTAMQKNMLLAVAAARECGLSAEEIIAGAEQVESAPLRWETLRVGDWRLVLDAYNANPLSMEHAIRTFAAEPRGGPKWLVLGGMAELGAQSAACHRELGTVIEKEPFDGIVLVGEQARLIGEEISSVPVYTAADAHGAAELLLAHSRPGAEVLVKASRADRLELILDYLPTTE